LASELVAIKLAVCTAESRTDPSIIIFGASTVEARLKATAWLAGATKAEAAATRREKRKKERILIVL